MRALISVSDKTGLVPFARGLAALGCEIISTGGTYKLLSDNGIPCIAIDSVTGFPEMMDGRVKTLHPLIHGGLLGLRDNEEHQRSAKEHNIQWIDLVVVNLYPFEKTIQKPDVTLEEAIENIDIGGPSMLRSASKNYKFVGVVVNPDRYETVLKSLQDNNGVLTDSLRFDLALEAFSHTARYDSLIADYLSGLKNKSQDKHFPDKTFMSYTKLNELRYGENPHQKAAFYVNGSSGLAHFKQLHGKELSYNNILDLEAAYQIVSSFELPAATVVKHNNPCGVAIADSISEAYKKAFEADSVSAFGGIVGLNRILDFATAELIASTFIEAVIAPAYEPDALHLLAQKPSIRLLELPNFIQPEWAYRFISGGLLIQENDQFKTNKDSLEFITELKPELKEINDLLFAFNVVRHVKSNAIVVVKNGQTLGIGAGQMSRIEAVEIALKKAGDAAKGAVLASDAFFPFSDSVNLASKTGIVSIIQPGGSKKDVDSVQACNELGLSMVFTGIRHFKH